VSPHAIAFTYFHQIFALSLLTTFKVGKFFPKNFGNRRAYTELGNLADGAALAWPGVDHCLECVLNEGDPLRESDRLSSREHVDHLLKRKMGVGLHADTRIWS
jgi:hypothetical protein